MTHRHRTPQLPSAPLTWRGVLPLVALAAVLGCDPEGGEDGGTSPVDGGSDDASPADDGAVSDGGGDRDGGASPDASVSTDGGGVGVDGGPPPPPGDWVPPIGVPRPPFGIEESVTDDEFTHWVDNTAAGCSDSGDGTPSTPRCSLPRNLASGSIVQVRGGPYEARNFRTVVAGTAESPVFVRGPSAGLVAVTGDDGVEFGGTYGILENVDAERLSIKGASTNDHLAMRHSYIHDNPGTGAMVFTGSNAHFIVFYNNEIARNGVIPSDRDHHGVSLGGGSSDVWIVDNHIHHNSGDAIQFCHGCIGDGNGPARVYIGRNLMHDDEENALDFKEFIGPVIVSENEIYGYVSAVNSNGDAIRINDEGDQGEIWVLNNEIYNSEIGINPRGSAATVYIIGNIVHDISRLSGIRRGADFVINNTVYDVGGIGIAADVAVNNIVWNATPSFSAETCMNNLSDDSSCGSTGDPMLQVDSANHLTGLAASSPAINAGTEHAAYGEFQARYGLSIRTNVGTIDIGALEQ